MEDGRVALGDMGFARHSSDPKPAVGFGTLQYSAPEVLMGLPADHKADVWAFGWVARACSVDEGTWFHLMCLRLGLARP